MPLDPSSDTHANRKLRAPDAECEDYALAALTGLPFKGRKGCIRKGTGLRKGGDRLSHFQGVANRDDLAYLTLSGKRYGSLTVARGHDRSFTHQRRLWIPGYSHPGGIQTIGHHVAVPLYGHGTGPAALHIYDPQLQLVCAAELATPRANCAGIANLSFGGGERYVLAVVSHSRGDRIDFYTSPIGEELGAGLSFDLHGTWMRQDADRADWLPDPKWYGFPNSLSLLADEGGGLYLLGLNTIRKWRKASQLSRWLIREDAFTAAGLGKDRAELYRVDLDAPPERLLRKVAQRKLKCHRPAFRWGASATVTSDTGLSIVACESEVFKKRSKKVDIDVFS